LARSFLGRADEVIEQTRPRTSFAALHESVPGTQNDSLFGIGSGKRSYRVHRLPSGEYQKLDLVVERAAI